MSRTNIFELASDISVVCANAGKRDIPISRCRIEVFTQLWGDTSCGFGGFAGQAMTNAFTILLYDDENNQVHVFINGRFAYTVYEPTQEFDKDVLNKCIAGKGSGRRAKYNQPKTDMST